MRKYKLSNKEQEKVSDEEASKYKDFGKIVTNYNQVLDRIHKKPFYKNPRAFLLLVLVVMVTLVVVDSKDSANPTDTEENETPDSVRIEMENLK